MNFKKNRICIKSVIIIIFIPITLNMKKFILLSLLGISLSSYAVYKVNVFDFHHLLGKCEGSDYCRICTNCSRCGYCKGGGTCGVCYSPRAIVRRSPSPKTYRPTKAISSSHAHAVRTGSPSVKRYNLQKSVAGKNPSIRKVSTIPESEDDSSWSEEMKLNEDTISSFINKAGPARELQPISNSPIISEEKETFVLEIPDNADFVRITAASANLREHYNTKSRILQKLNHGDLLIKLKSVRGWVKVQALDSGAVGYVSVSLLQ